MSNFTYLWIVQSMLYFLMSGYHRGICLPCPYRVASSNTGKSNKFCKSGKLDSVTIGLWVLINDHYEE